MVVAMNSREPMKPLACRAGLLLCVVLSGCSREVKTEQSSRLPEHLVQIAAANAWTTSTVQTAAPADEPVYLVGADAPPRSAAPSLATVLYSEHDAEIAPRMEGIVKRIEAELDDAVRSGQVLAVLHDDAEAAAVRTAEAAVELAQLEYSRAQQLREQQMISQSELDQAAYRLRFAQAALEEAQVRLGYTRVRAPFAGVVSRRFIRVGQSVVRGEPLFRVTALHPLWAQVRVPEQEARGLARGQSLPLRSPGGEEVAGSIRRISPAVDPGSGTVEVLLGIADPKRLRPGSAVAVELPGGAREQP
jgi:membrane fusion protein, multidrug efflux system